MSSSLSEFAYDDNLRLSQRLAEIQQRVTILQSRGGGAPPINVFAALGESVLTVSGLTLTSNISTVTVRWNPVTAADLLYYEVQIAETVDFASLVTRQTQELEYTHYEGGPDVRLFLRVRAVAQSGVGPFTLPVDSFTGLIQTVNLAPNAISNYGQVAAGDGSATFECDVLIDNGSVFRGQSALKWDGTSGLGFDPGPYTGAFRVAFRPASVLIETIGGPVLLRATFGVHMVFDDDFTANLRVLRNGAVVYDSGPIEYNNIGSAVTVDLFLPSVAILDIPPPGLQLFETEVTVDATSGGGRVEVREMLMSALELRR